MADNIILNAGTGGSALRTDDDGTAHWQYVKLSFGADNTQTIVGSTSSNPLPVALSDTDNTVLDNILTSVQLADDTVYVDDADWTALSSKHNVIGGVYQSTPGTITDGDTGPFRVDANGAIHINDGGNSITVDGTVTANPASGTIDTVTNLAQMGGVAIALNTGVRSTGTQRVTIATDDLVPVTGTITAVTDITNTIDSTISGAALTALQLIDNPVFADDAAFTLASSSVSMSGAIRDDSLTTLTAIEGDAVPLRVGSTGALHVTGGGGGTEYTEDVATANPIVGTATLIERDDALTTVTPIEGDWIGLRGSAEGALWVQDFNSDAILTDTNTIAGDTTSIDGKITACNTGAVVISSGTVTAVTDITNTIDSTISGAALTALQLIDNPIVAHDAAASGASGLSMAGAYATNSIEGLTQVAAADAARIVSDLNGVLVTRPHTTLEENLSERVSDTAGTSTNFTNFAAGGAGIHNYITSITVHNSHASTNGYVDIRDGSAGSVIWTVPAPATGGAVLQFDPPLKGAANTALAYDVSAAISTVYISVNGFQGQG